jgi:adapter protein MecA 1/2
MKFTRVNKDTVNCIITEDDMDEQGLKLEDLFDKSKEAMDFLHDVMERAAQEVDYKPTGAFTPMQITVLPDHSISLTLSENAEEAFADMLRNLTEKAGLKLPKNFLEELGDVSEEERIPKLSEYLQNLKEFTSSVRDMAKKVGDAVEDKNNGELPFIAADDTRKSSIKKDKKSKKKKKSSDVFDKLNFTSFVFEYDSLRTVIKLTEQIPKKYTLGSSLYKNSSNGKYYMLCDRGSEKARNFASVFSICYEFGRFVTTKDIAIYHMDENFDTIISENAIERLRKL